MLLLISDANILIDMEDGNLTPVIFRLPYENEGVEVHGTIWIIEELLNQKIIQQSQAKGSFDAMRVKGSRLPWGDVEKLLSKWELIGAKNE